MTEGPNAEASRLLRANARTAQGSRSDEVLLRLMATSDLHGHVRAYDYARGRPHPGLGLEAAARVIAQLRGEVDGSLLLDAGDFLFGSALGDMAAGTPWRGINPVMAAMSALGYDAAGLGNHEFDFGRAVLISALGDRSFPVLCTNLDCPQGADEAEEAIRKTALVSRRLRDAHGGAHDLNIGIVSFLPPDLLVQIHRKRPDLAGCQLSDVAQAAERWVPHLRAQGADLVVALCHDGMEVGDPDRPGSPLELARRGDIDALVMGHQHGLFPRRPASGPRFAGPERPPHPDIDPVGGLLAGVPAIMPGCWGQHVGRLDLRLARETGGGWRVRSSDAAIQASGAKPMVPTRFTERAGLRLITQRAHRRARHLSGRALGELPRGASTYLARLGRCPCTMLVAQVMADTVRHLMPDLDGLPVVGLAAPHRSGGAGGAANFVDIPQGPLRNGHLDAIYPFPDRICAIEITGAQLWDWVERSAAGFRQIRAERSDQFLVDPEMPGSDFHFGPDLHATLDLSRAARFTAAGRHVAGAPGRVTDLTWQGRRVALDGRLMLAVTEYRACGGGAMPGCVPENLRWTSSQTLRAALGDGAAPAISGRLWSSAMTLVVPDAAHPVFLTGPGALAHPGDLTQAGLNATWRAGSEWLECRLAAAAAPLEIGRGPPYLNA